MPCVDQMSKCPVYHCLPLCCVAASCGRPLTAVLMARPLRSPSLVAIRLSVVYETWSPIGWHQAFVIGWSRYRSGLPSAPLHYDITWPVGIPTVFRPQWQSLCTALTAGKCLPLGLCKGTVKESICWHIPCWHYLCHQLIIQSTSSVHYTALLECAVSSRWPAAS